MIVVSGILFAKLNALRARLSALEKEKAELEKRAKFLEKMIKQFPDAKSAVKKVRSEMNDCIEDLGNAITGSTGVTNACVAISQETTLVYGCDNWADKRYLEAELQRVRARIAELEREISNVNSQITSTRIAIENAQREADAANAIENEEDNYREQYGNQSSGGNNGGCGC